MVDGCPDLRLWLKHDLIHDAYDNGADGRPIHPQNLRGRNALAEDEDGFAGARADGVDGKQGVAAVVAVWLNRLDYHKFGGIVGRMFQALFVPDIDPVGDADDGGIYWSVFFGKGIGRFPRADPVDGLALARADDVGGHQRISEIVPTVVHRPDNEQRDAGQRRIFPCGYNFSDDATELHVHQSVES